MNIETLRWLLLAVNSGSFKNTDESICKGKALIEVSKLLDAADAKAKKKAEKIAAQAAAAE